MADLVAFLRAQYDEEADYARDAAEEVGDGRWQQRGPRIVTVADRDREVTDYGIVECIQHLIRHDPARVLADVEAKRRILDMHPHRRFGSLPEEWPEHWRAEIKQAFPGTVEPYIGCEHDDFNHDYEVFEPAWWCETVRLLALPYADQPNYDPSWSVAKEGETDG